MKTLLLLLAATLLPAEERPARVLLLSGANNHQWQQTTPVLAGLLTGSGRFTVTVRDDVPGMVPADLAGIDLVVGNFNTFGRKTRDQVWSDAMRQAFIAHIQAGAGFVGVHAGSSLWYDWPAFTALAGGRWGKGTHHGAQRTATLRFTDPAHPITAGLPESFTTRDEFWQQTEMAEGVHLLATVVVEGDQDGRAEPMAWTTTCGQGRGVTLLLGHDRTAMEQPAFATLFVRGCRWAATGGAPAPR